MIRVQRTYVKRTLGITVLLAASVLFVACPSPFDGSSANDSGASGSVVVAVETALEAQSIIPEVESLVDEYHITLSRSGFADVSASTTTVSALIETLAVGTWSVLVEAIDTGPDPDVVVGSGSAAVSIVAGATETVAVTVTPRQSGSGGIDISVSWPIGQIDGVTLAGLQLDGEGPPGDISAALTVLANGRRYVNTAIASGSYVLTLILERAGNPVTTVIEAVQVYDNVVTTGSIALAANEIGQAPTSPSGFTASLDGFNVNLSWTDNANTETGYELQRRVGNAAYEALSVEPAGTVSYTDTTAPQGSSVTYRVRATNQYGDSAFVTSNAVSVPAEPIVFVAPAPVGQAGATGTRGNPVDTLSEGLDIAVANGYTDVRIAAGTITENAVVEIDIDGVMISGAHDPSNNWAQDTATLSTTITIDPGSISAAENGVIAIGPSNGLDVAIADLDIRFVSAAPLNILGIGQAISVNTASGNVTLDRISIDADARFPADLWGLGVSNGNVLLRDSRIEVGGTEFVNGSFAFGVAVNHGTPFDVVEILRSEIVIRTVDATTMNGIEIQSGRLEVRESTISAESGFSQDTGSWNGIQLLGFQPDVLVERSRITGDFSTSGVNAWGVQQGSGSSFSRLQMINSVIDLRGDQNTLRGIQASNGVTSTDIAASTIVLFSAANNAQATRFLDTDPILNNSLVATVQTSSGSPGLPIGFDSGNPAGSGSNYFATLGGGAVGNWTGNGNVWDTATDPTTFFVDPSGTDGNPDNDFALAVGAPNDLKQGGADLSGSGLTIDFVGTVRTGNGDNGYSIGAFEQDG